MLKECFCCCLVSMMIGAVVGVVLVVSNKNVEKTFKKGTEIATEKIEEIKEKIEDSKSKKSSNAKN